MSQQPMGPGDVLGDRYIMRKSEWNSALGPVWSARDRVLDRAVLVQFLSPALAADPRAGRTFSKASARIAQVSHPGVLRVYDIGESPAFAVFEYPPGGRLAERLSAGPLGATEGARAALTLARGLEALHQHGAFHGTLSPSSVLLDEEGRAKILANGATDTVGTSGDAPVREQPPGYVPPEPNATPEERDRYALAALTYHMLTGRAPIGGTTAKMPGRGVPAGLDQLLRRALSVVPSERPTLDSFVGALAPFARVVPRDARSKRFRSGEFRWLVPTAIIVVLGTLAATVGVQLSQDYVRRHQPQATRAPSPRPGPGVPVQGGTVSDFDPEGAKPGPGHENPGLTGKSIDGDPRTYWRTENYQRIDVGGKSGVGLLFDLGDLKAVRSVRVQSTLPGWEAQVRVASVAGTSASDFTVAGMFTAATDQTVSLRARTRARFVLLWITRLTDDGSHNTNPYRAEVAEVEFFS